jgi:hypothetical protein
LGALERLGAKLLAQRRRVERLSHHTSARQPWNQFGERVDAVEHHLPVGASHRLLGDEGVVRALAHPAGDANFEAYTDADSRWRRYQSRARFARHTQLEHLDPDQAECPQILVYPAVAVVKSRAAIVGQGVRLDLALGGFIPAVAIVAPDQGRATISMSLWPVDRRQIAGD